jgi:hypothetical protein
MLDLMIGMAALIYEFVRAIWSGVACQFTVMVGYLNSLDTSGGGNLETRLPALINFLHGTGQHVEAEASLVS